MGTTIRREPNLTALPKKVTPHYENVLNFKGLHITDNPFTADDSSASDMLNVYVDDNNALTVRPRLEKDTDYDTLVGNNTLIKVEPLKNGKILLLLDDTTPVVKLVINNTTYTVSGVGTLNVNTCNFYEDGDISVDGKIYLFDENGAKYISKSGSAYVCGSISDIAYVPTVEINKDLNLGKTRENEPYNAFSTNYKISYATKETPYDTPVTNFISKSITLNTANGKHYSFTPSKKEDIQFYNAPAYFYGSNDYINHISMDASGAIRLYVTQSSKQVYISKDYGNSFEVFKATKNSLEYTPIDIIKAWISGDGTTVITLDVNGVLARYKNNIYVNEFNTRSYTNNGITYSSILTINSTPIDRLNDITVAMSYTGNDFIFNNMYTGGTNNYTYLLFSNADFSTIKIYTVVINSNYSICDDLYMNALGTYCVYGGTSSAAAGIIDTTKAYATSGTYVNPRTLTYVVNLMSYNVNNPYDGVWLDNNNFSFIGYLAGQFYGFINLNITDSTNITTSDYTIKTLNNNSYTKLICVNSGLYMSSTTNNMAFVPLTSSGTAYGFGDVTTLTVNPTGTRGLSSTTLISNGVFYDYDLDNHRVYSNNAYSSDIDWLTVEYTDHTSGYKINKSTNYAIWRDSLWLYGYKNQLSWSGIVDGKRDFTYVPENQIFELGIDTTPVSEKSDITGFNIVGDSVASAYKRDKIYLITPTTVNNIDTYIYSECKAEQGNDTMGQTVVTPLTALPIQVNRDGVFALTNLTNVYAADKVATLISAKINEKFLKEDLSNIKLIAFKYWLFIFIPGDISKVYVYDDRAAEWYYWELPIKVLNIFKTHDNLYCVGDDNVVFKFNPKEKVVSIDSSDAVTLYYDDVYIEGADNCFDAYGVQGKNIVWYWASQILPLNSVSYAKQLNKTTFIVADSDVTDGYAFNFTIKGWRKKRTLVKSSDLDGTVYSVQATTKRTNINRAHFIQLTVTNAMLENHQLVLSKTLKTDIDTNDQKVRLIGVSFKFKYLEV